MKPIRLAFAALLLAQLAPLHAGAAPKPLKVFILAGQSNMDGQANVSTIDFLGEDPDKDRAVLLKTFKPDGKTLVITTTAKGVSLSCSARRWPRRCRN